MHVASAPGDADRIFVVEQAGRVRLIHDGQTSLFLDVSDVVRGFGPPDIVDFDSGLNKAGYHLRDALGDDAENPRFIETLTQRRYRFLAQVETDAVEPLSPPPTV